MIVNPLPRGLTAQLKIIPLSLLFLSSGGFVKKLNVVSSLLFLHSITSYLFIASNFNTSLLPFLSRFILFSTVSLIPALIVCVVWIVKYKAEWAFLHNVSGLMAISSILISLPRFPGVTNHADSVIVVQGLLFILVTLTELHSAVILRSLSSMGWTSHLSPSHLYQWMILSSARCYLFSIYLSLCYLYFSKAFYCSPLMPRRRRHFTHPGYALKDYHSLRTKALFSQSMSTPSLLTVTDGSLALRPYPYSLLLPRSENKHDEPRFTLGAIYATGVFIGYLCICHQKVWLKSTSSNYSPDYYGFKDLVLYYVSYNIFSKSSLLHTVTKILLYLVIFISVWCGYFNYLGSYIRNMPYINSGLSEAFYRKGFHVTYLLVIIFLIGDPILLFVSSTVVIVTFCILESLRGRINTTFHTLTDQFVADKRCNVELSHIHLLLSGSMFQAIYFLSILSNGPNTDSVCLGVTPRQQLNIFSNALHMIRARNTKNLMADSFLPAGIVTTIISDACAVFTCIIHSLIVKESPPSYKQLHSVCFKRNFTILSIKAKEAKSDSGSRNSKSVSNVRGSNIRNSNSKALKSLGTSVTNMHTKQIQNRALNGLKCNIATYSGPSLFTKIYPTLLTKGRTPLGTLGFAVTCLLVCTLVFDYSIGISIVVSITTSFAETCASIDNIVLPFVFINVKDIMYYFCNTAK